MNYFQPGDRVRLYRCTDPHTHLRPGSLGTVTFVDDMRTIHVDWDNGAKLGMIPGEDVIELVKRAEP